MTEVQTPITRRLLEQRKQIFYIREIMAYDKAIDIVRDILANNPDMTVSEFRSAIEVYQFELHEENKAAA